MAAGALLRCRAAPTIGAMLVSPGHERDEYWFREGCFITEWSNSDADPDVSVARARVEPGGTTRWHRLDAITERYVVLAGCGRAEVDREARDVQAGDVVIIAPGLPQRITNTGDTDLIFLAVCTPRFRPENYREIPELEEST